MGAEKLQVEQELDKGIKASVAELWEAFAQDSQQEKRVAAVLKLGLLSMAKEPLRKAEKPLPTPFTHPPWLDVARTAISEFVDQQPEREVLLRTVFFKTDISSEHRLDVLVSASVIPAGVYDECSFAAGVASGNITARPWGDASPK